MIFKIINSCLNYEIILVKISPNLIESSIKKLKIFLVCEVCNFYYFVFFKTD